MGQAWTRRRRLALAGIFVAGVFAGVVLGRVSDLPPVAHATGLYSDWCVYSIRDGYDIRLGSYKSMVVIAGRTGWFSFMTDYDIRRAATDYDCERVY